MPLSDLGRLRDATRRRESSWDRSGGNADYVVIPPGGTHVMADVAGPGCVRHIWMTLNSPEIRYPRRSVLRMRWDGADSPCVEVPSGDFFGVGHGLTPEYWSLPLTMSPRSGRGWNSYWPMPFNERAYIDITNEGEQPLVCYFYVDWEQYAAPQAEIALFHAQYRQQRPTDGWGRVGASMTNAEREEFWKRANLEGEGNYVILEASGRGHYVG